MLQKIEGLSVTNNMAVVENSPEKKKSPNKFPQQNM